MVSTYSLLYNAAAKDPSFDTRIPVGFNNTVYTQSLLTNGSIILGGAFTTYQGSIANRIIRLNSDGSIDTSFNIGTGFSSNVRALALQSDAKIIVGGQFNTYQGIGVNYIIRLNSDGGIDTSFSIGTGFFSIVHTLDVQSDGKIVVGGAFTNYQGVGANYIVRLNSDGSRDTSFNLGTGFNNTINVISIRNDGKIIVSGFFISYQDNASNRIMRLNTDGSIDTNFNIGSGLDGAVRVLSAQSDGKIIVGGEFRIYQGTSANRIVRLNNNGNRDNSFNIGTGVNNNIVYALTVQVDGKIIVGGSFFLIKE